VTAQDPPGLPENCDFDDDDVVDSLGYLALAGNFGQGLNESRAMREAASFALLVLFASQNRTAESLPLGVNRLVSSCCEFTDITLRYH
jgi:hypothetical protein